MLSANIAGLILILIGGCIWAGILFWSPEPRWVKRRKRLLATFTADSAEEEKASIEIPDATVSIFCAPRMQIGRPEREWMQRTLQRYKEIEGIYPYAETQEGTDEVRLLGIHFRPDLPVGEKQRLIRELEAYFALSSFSDQRFSLTQLSEETRGYVEGLGGAVVR